MGFGILVVKLRFTPDAAPRGHGWELGIVFTLAGLPMTLGANRHYFQGLRAIESDSFEPARHWINACSALICSVGLGVVAYLFAASQPAFVSGGARSRRFWGRRRLS